VIRAKGRDLLFILIPVVAAGPGILAHRDHGRANQDVITKDNVSVRSARSSISGWGDGQGIMEVE
jgi:hypothetical protein